MPAPRVRAERFADTADDVMFPRLSEAKLQKFRKLGQVMTAQPGDVLFEQGVRDAPFYVLVSGAVDFVDRRPDAEVWFSRVEVPTFLGDIAMFTGEPTVVACLAAAESELIVFPRPKLRRMLAEWPEFSEMVLDALSARREWLEQEGHGVLRLIADRSSRRAFEVRDLLERNLLPVKWYDTANDPESDVLLDSVGLDRGATPVLIRNDTVLRNPSSAQVARELGLRAEVDGDRFDLVILGAGPAGLAAAVYGGSEGLSTFVAESWGPGGQAGTSMRIENYLGFPTGVSGEELTRRATLQARRFDAQFSSFHPAVEVVDGPDGLLRVDLADGQHVLARSLLVATGARWRRLQAENLERFEGAGVYYAASRSDAARCRGEDVVVVGGGNSAGQAAGHLETHAQSVTVVVRRDGLEATMSQYLIDRLEHRPNVRIVTSCEIAGFEGETGLSGVRVRHRDGGEETIPASAAFLMIGAEPCSEMVRGMLATDDRGFLSAGMDALSSNGGGPQWAISDREPHLLETTREGVFAAGDVRSGSTKRVAAAVGDGSMAVRFAHEVLSG